MDGQSLWVKTKRRLYSRSKIVLHIIVIFLALQEKTPELEWGRISLGVTSQILKCDAIINRYKKCLTVYNLLFSLIIGECSGRLKSNYFVSYFKNNKSGIKYTETDREWFAYFDIFKYCLSEMKQLGVVDDEKELELILDVERVQFS